MVGSLAPVAGGAWRDAVLVEKLLPTTSPLALFPLSLDFSSHSLSLEIS